MKLDGYRRDRGALGARNHLLVLPSVVCADNTASRIAAAGGVAVVHQHGCGQVGEDALHTERSLRGYALNPNVGAVIVVSLGCETVQGRVLHERLAAAGQRTAFSGIQLMGGTDLAAAAGQSELEALRRDLDRQPREPGTAADLRIGIETAAATVGRAADLVEAAQAAGARVAVAFSRARPAGPWATAPSLVYGEPAAADAEIAVIEHAGDGAEQHVALAAAGAQVIVSLRGPRQAPVGSAIVPVIAVAGDEEIHLALRDDFDLPPTATCGDILDVVEAVFSGEQSAAERRGAADFVLRRMARTM